MTWLTASELAGMPDMPSSEFRTREKLARLGVPSRPRLGREGGGGMEYDTSRLPAPTRQAIAARLVLTHAAPSATSEPEPQPVQQPAAPEPETALQATAGRRPPSDDERLCADARTALVHVLGDMAHTLGVKRAAARLALELAAGQAPRGLIETAAQANQRRRGADAMPSARTLERWLGAHREQGWWGLIPASSAPAALSTVEQDVAAVIGLYHSRDGRFRNLSAAAKEVTRQLDRPFDTWSALYKRAARALPKVDPVSLIKARHSGAQRAARLPFKRRDTTVLRPLDVWVIDGHSFKAKVRHPDHGAPFTPEVTVVIDAATRLICGWSASLSENMIAVGDALRHAVGNCGVPAVVYSDNGAGETGRQIDCPVSGIMARLGTEHRTGLPGHPQGRGLIERSWKTHMIECARQFGTYMGSDADSGTYKRAAAELAREQRALKRKQQTGEVVKLSTKAPSWAQFVEAVERQVQAYNAEHRHRGLPRHEDGPHEGKRMTPREAWAQMLDPSRQIKLSTLDLRLLFMPAVLRTAQRGEVAFFNQHYQAPELMRVDGQQVSVRYDIHDPSFVMVFDTAGQFICEAQWNRNRIDYMPRAVVEIGHEKRVRAMVKRLEQKIDTASAELRRTADPAPLSLPEPSTPLVFDLPATDRLTPDRMPQVVAGAEQAAPGRPFFSTQADRYEWLMARRGEWEDEDRSWVAEYAASEDYQQLADYYAGRGLAWAEQQGEESRGAR